MDHHDVANRREIDDMRFGRLDNRLFRTRLYDACGQRIKGQARHATADFLNPRWCFPTLLE